jgi:catechol 2,3-dioxygenase-like lactoylglutathione lyase family enzyme
LAVRKIIETGVYVTDLEAARDFYTRVLGLEFYSGEPNRHVFLKAGKSMLLLFSAATTLQEKRLPPPLPLLVPPRAPANKALEIAAPVTPRAAPPPLVRR